MSRRLPVPLTVAIALNAAALLVSSSSRAQNCTGVGYFEACLDAVGGASIDGTTPRDPTRIINDIFRTTDTPPRFAPQLTFGQLMASLSAINSPGCNGGISSGVPGTDPRQYTSYQCQSGVTASQSPSYVNALDWRWAQNIRVRTDGALATDQDNCGGNAHLCGFETPWLSGMIFDLQGPANRVVVFPITDHVADSCLEAFEYSVYLTDDPRSHEFVPVGNHPDPRRWNRAVLTRGFLRGWTNNYQSTGTVADQSIHPLTDSAGGEAIADSIATVWSLPCGITFRYVAVVSGNGGNPDARCAFYSSEDEFDAVAGLNEDGSALCADRDGDGFRDAVCGGSDCDDTNPAINPGATEDCRTATDQNCDRAVPACPTGTTCVNGVCAAACLEGSCADGFNCVSTPTGGACVPVACAGVTCAAGQICGPSGCQAPCDGAHCPIGQTCLGGACVDLCAGVSCSSNQHCEAGRCVPNCSCTGCAAPWACDLANGRCEAPGCSDLTCPPEERDCTGTAPRCATSFCDGVRCPLGQTCVESSRACLVDRCFGIACAPPLTCADGQCVAPGRDAGADTGDATSTDSGGGDSQLDASSHDGGVHTDGRADGGTRVYYGACGCRTPGSRSTDRNGIAVVLFAMVAMACRRVGRRTR